MEHREHMPGPNTQINDSEKAAIFALAAGILDTWKTAFLAAEAGKPSGRKAESLNTTVTRWKHSAKVQTFYEYSLRLLADRDSDARQRGREEAAKMMEEEKTAGENESVKRARPAVVDYNNPDARRQLYNKIISESVDDPRTQLDAAKVIEQLQRDDRQAAQDNKVQRAYLPVNCQICPMYQKRKEKPR